MEYDNIRAFPPVRGDWVKGTVTIEGLPKDKDLITRLVRAVNMAMEPFKEEVSVPMEMVSGH